MIIMMMIMMIKFINDNNRSNDRNHHNDYNDDDNDKNFVNDNGDQTIFHAIHFGELFACEKTEFCEIAQILMCLHSVNPCLIYREGLRFLKNHRNESSRFERKIHGEREETHVGSKHCFSFVMYGHCDNNALYSASLSLMFIFLLTLFDTSEREEMPFLIDKIFRLSFKRLKILVK